MADELVEPKIRNQMALAFIRGQCSGCKSCAGVDCSGWIIEQILCGRPYVFCDTCGELVTSNEPECEACAEERRAEAAESAGGE